MILSAFIAAFFVLGYANKADAVGFSFARIITIDHTKVPNTDQTNFPVLISGTYSYLATAANGGEVQNSNGYDVGFYATPDCSTTKLNWETEKYVATTGEVDYWVSIPTVSHTSDTTFYLCYGNSSVTTDQSNKTGVWDANFQGVWHLPDGTSLSAADSTSNGRNGTLQNTPTATTGEIDGAGAFNSASSQYITATKTSALTSFTVSAWVNPSSSQSGLPAILTDIYNGAGVNYDLSFNNPTNSIDNKIYGGFYDGSWHVASSATAPSTGVWTFATFTYDGTTLKLYINNSTVQTTSYSGTPLNSGVGIRIGRRWDQPDYFNGSIDEVRLSSVARNADWIATEYNNQSFPSTFYSVGNENQPTTISGTVYTDEGATTMASGRTVRIKVNGLGDYSAATDASGQYSISNVLTSAGDVVTIYLDGATEKAVTVTRASGSDMTGMDLYQNYLIVRSDDGNAITNANLGQYDADNDADIKFTSNSGTLTTTATTNLILNTSSTFTPGGDVTVNGGYKQTAGTFNGGSGTIKVTIAYPNHGFFALSGGTFNSTTGLFQVGADWIHTSGGTFNHNNGTVENVQGAGQTWDFNTSETFYNFIADAYNETNFIIATGDTLIVENNFTHTSGYVNTGTVEVRGNVTINSGAKGGNGTISFLVAGDQTITSSGGKTASLNINKPSGSVSVTGNLGIGKFTLASGTFVSTSGTLTVGVAGAGGWIHTSGGTFNHNNGTVQAVQGANQTWDFDASETFYDFIADAYGQTGIPIASGDTLIVENDFTHTSGYINTGTVEVRGNVTINSGAFGGSSPLVFTGSNDQTYTDNGGNELNGDITINKSGGSLTLSSNADWNATSQDLTITQGVLNQGAYDISVAGNLTTSGTFNGGSGAITVSGLYIQTGGTFTSTSGTFTVGMNINGTGWSHSSGTFSHNNGTVVMGTTCNCFTIIDVPTTETFYDLDLHLGTSSSTLSVAAGDTVVIVNDLTHTSGKLNGTGIYEVQGSMTVASTANGGGATLSFSVAGDQVITAGGGATGSLSINKSSGTVSVSGGNLRINTFTLSSGNFTAPSGTLTVDMNINGTGWSHSSGTFNNNNGTVVLGTGCNCFTIINVPTTETFYDLNVNLTTNDSTLSVATGDTLIVTHALTHTNGKLGKSGDGTGTIEVQGDMTVASTADVGIMALAFTGSNSQTITAAATLSTGTFTVNKTNASDTVTLASNVTFGGALTVTKGILDQGASYNLQTAGTLTVGASGTWQNTGTGDITLGGNVSNAGTIILNSNNGEECTDAGNDIAVTSSSGGTQRTWSGAGTFTLINLSVTDMLGALTAYDSSFSNSNWTNGTPVCGIAISGTVYTDEGTTTMTSGPTVRIKVNGAGDYSATANGSGVYSVSGITAPAAGDVITAFLDGATEKAVAVTRAEDGDDLSGLDLYQNYLIVRHEDGGPATNADLGTYDGDDDGDIFFTANAGALAVDEGTTLYVTAGMTFAPGGDVATAGLTIAGTYDNSANDPDLTVNGDLSINSGATFTKGAGTLTLGKAGALTVTDATAGQDLGKVVVASSAGGESASWWNSSWLSREKITLDNSASSENLVNFPVLIQLSSSNIDYSKTQNNGEDIRFVDPDGTSLSYEIEKWDESGTSLVWVKVPQIDAGSTTDNIWMYYNNPAATDGQTATSVWDADYKGVWHFSGNANDSTSNGDNGTATGVSSAAGQAGSAYSFNGTSSKIVLNSAKFPSSYPLTFDIWVSTTNTDTEDVMTPITLYNSGNNSSRLMFEIGEGSINWNVRNPSREVEIGVPAPEDGLWHHIVGVSRSASDHEFYVDGQLVDDSSTSVTFPTVNTAEFGHWHSPDNETWFEGLLDEARVSNVGRSANWIEAEYLFEADNSKYAYGDEEDFSPAWWNSSWLSREKITLDNSASSENLVNFPVLIQLSSSNIDYSKTQNNGEDIRFVDPDGTSLSYEIEKWDESGTSLVWVKVPQIDAGSTTDYIYMYYGNAAAEDGQSPTGVWDSSFKSVYHLPNAVTLSANDSTSNANNGTVNGATPAAGEVGGGASFNGSTNYIDANAGLLNGLTNASISYWAKGNGAAWGQGDSSTSSFMENTRVFFRDGTNQDLKGISNPYDAGAWHYYTVTSAPSSVTIYKDGAIFLGPTSTSTRSAITNAEVNNFRIGEVPAGTSGDTSHFNGSIDEFRVSATVRSADWVEAEYLFEKDNTKYTYGDEEVATVVNLGSDIKLSSLAINSQQAVIADSHALTVTGDAWTNDGIFDAGAGTVNFAPDEPAAPVVIGGLTDNQFHNFSAAVADTQLQFAVGKQVTIGGSFTVAGAADHPVTLHSTVSDLQWIINLTGTASVSYASVKDAGCAEASNSIATSHSTDELNNGGCWVFAAFSFHSGYTAPTEAGDGGGTPTDGGSQGGGTGDGGGGEEDEPQDGGSQGGGGGDASP